MKSFSHRESPRFSQNGRKLSRGKFPTKFPGKMSRHFLSGKFSYKSFLRKYLIPNFIKVWFTGWNQLYNYKLLVTLWWNFVEKISRRENFGKSGKLPDGKISPREFPRHFRVFSGNRAVKRCEKVASGDFRETFSPVFSEIPGKTVGKISLFRKFPDEFPSEILGE